MKPLPDRRRPADRLAGARGPRPSVGAGWRSSSPWSRPAAAGTNGVGYMVLVNHGAAPDALEKVESPLASRVEMHSSAMAGGVMSMARQVWVSVPPGGRG